ncbi:MAG: hypothetical protein DRJ10_02885 [Bacteroidetes bacterium]|nr:MAG: hypothetical protein DRJ10_02885 [Bacteroidota bacterium]
MYRLSLLILVLIGIIPIKAQSPHGDELEVDCALCHNPESWSINYKTIEFDHIKTNFILEGTHVQTECKLCHPTLVFNEAQSQCFSCHDDMHSMSVGNDCARCHTPQSWLVDNIPELHEENGFPLVGSHNNLSCVDCHLSETNLRFDRIGNECINCHRDDYNSTQDPNHASAGFSTQCLDCHNPLGLGWDTDIIKHDFFALTLGHDIQDCSQCHVTGNYSSISPECVSCHQNDYNESSNPNHQSLNFSIDCASCHTTDPDWMPATFDHDGPFFPIYSGEHQGEWDNCNECHTNPNNYSEFSCIICHINPETDNGHSGVSGYFYENNACLACHPTGSKDEGFNHNSTNFPLSGAHIGVDCMKCHPISYQGTSTDCNSCHNKDFNSSTNPNHNSVGISTDCISCHTTEPGWMPASFDIHNNIYQLNGAHATIANDCAACHNGDYTSTPNTCVGCHQADYNSTTNPNHGSAQFPTDCMQCHNESAWVPSTFDHDGQYFPIYSGAHSAAWNDCIECHTNANDYSVFTCLTCHSNPETDNDHSEVTGYAYESNACLQCHPNGTN